jgi:hypothetical protein
MLTRLEQWKVTGVISTIQCDALSALVRRDRVSVFVELNVLLYLGVLSFVTGVGLTATTYSARLGDATILSSLACLFGWSLYYCFDRALPYSNRHVEHPGLAFDYVLYLGCLTFAIGLGYLESRFHPFGRDWDHSLLAAAGVFFGLAYRLDNRLVLSLALSSLGAWFGVRVTHFGFFPVASARLFALAYGGLVAGAGTVLLRAGIKQHFLETYLHLAANVLFVALLSGAGDRSAPWLLYLAALLALAGLAIVQGVRFKRFVFVVYGVVYGYAGVSARLLHELSSLSAVLMYFVISGTLVTLALVLMARRFGRDA